MPFTIRVLPSRARVIEHAPGTRGSVLAESLVNESCLYCRQPIGLDAPFHEANNRVYHAECLPVRAPAPPSEEPRWELA